MVHFIFVISYQKKIRSLRTVDNVIMMGKDSTNRTVSWLKK
jgi:hypothetical protein